MASTARTTEYVLPARRLTGTREEVLREIDETVQHLIVLRQWIAMSASEAADAPPRGPVPTEAHRDAGRRR
jgi:hypothetical protein